MYLILISILSVLWQVRFRGIVVGTRTGQCVPTATGRHVQQYVTVRAPKGTRLSARAAHILCPVKYSVIRGHLPGLGRGC